MAWNAEEGGFEPTDDWGFNPGGGQPGAGARVESNPAGAGEDPFAYTNGSLLTPWTEQFNYGGPAAPEGGYYHGSAGFSPLAPLNYADFAYNYKAPSAYSYRGDMNAPTPFTADRFAERPDFKSPVPGYVAPRYKAPSPFVAPGEEGMKEDPGYQIRVNRGIQALENSAAARGMDRSANTWKGLLDYGEDSASQEYGKVYDRRKGEYDTSAELGLAEFDRNSAAGLTENELAYNRAATEYDRSYQNALQRYQMGYQQAAGEHDRNFSEMYNVHNANASNSLAAWRNNADVDLAGQKTGFEIGSGVWDRNYGKAATAYAQSVQQAETAASISSAEAAASAGSAQWANSTNYNRALGEYGMRYDQFNNNQTNQYNRIYGQQVLGAQTAGVMGGNAGQFAANAGNATTNQGNAAAAGQVGSANAWAAGVNAIGNSASQYALLAGKPPKLTYPGQVMPTPGIP